MAKFVAISGPSATGKTSLVDELSFQAELRDAVFIPDPFSTVWNRLVETEIFSEYEDVSRDYNYLCIFIIQMIEQYREFINKYKDQDKLVILDSSWIDLSIYSVMNMWYTRTVKELQEKILKDLSSYEDIGRVYITTYDEEKSNVVKYRTPFKRYNVKNNRPLELQYYKLAAHFDNAMELPTSDRTEAALFIIEDLKELGYL